MLFVGDMCRLRSVNERVVGLNGEIPNLSKKNLVCDNMRPDFTQSTECYEQIDVLHFELLRIENQHWEMIPLSNSDCHLFWTSPFRKK